MAKKSKKRKATPAKRRRAPARRRPSTSGTPSRRKGSGGASSAAVKKTLSRQGIGVGAALGVRYVVDHTDMVKGADRDTVDAVQGGGGLLMMGLGFAMKSPTLITMGGHQVTAAGSAYSARRRCEKPASQGADFDPISLFKDGLMTSGLPSHEADALIEDLASPEIAGPITLLALLKQAMGRLREGGGEQARAAQDVALAAAGECGLDADGYAITETGRLRDRLPRFRGLIKRRRQGGGGRGGGRKGPLESRRERKELEAQTEALALTDPGVDPEAEQLLRELEAAIV